MVATLLRVRGGLFRVQRQRPNLPSDAKSDRLAFVPERRADGSAVELAVEHPHDEPVCGPKYLAVRVSEYDPNSVAERLADRGAHACAFGRTYGRAHACPELGAHRGAHAGAFDDGRPIARAYGRMRFVVRIVDGVRARRSCARTGDNRSGGKS